MKSMLNELTKIANELDAMGPGWSEDKGSLESCFDKAVEEENKQKATKKAPNVGEAEVKQIEKDLQKSAEFREDHRKPKMKKKVEKVANEYIVTDLNAILNKIASVNPITDEEVSAIAYTFQKKAHENQVKAMEKLAAEEEKDLPTKKDLEAVKKMAEFKFDNAATMESGTFIVFPEINGSDISMTPAVVLVANDDITGNSFKFVVSNDGRIKLLQNEMFICKKTGNPFKLQTTELRTLLDGNMFFALNRDSVIAPSIVSYISSLSIGGFGEENKIRTIGYNYEMSILNSQDKVREISRHGTIHGNFEGIGSSKVKTKYNIVTLNDTKFDKISYDEFVKRKAEESVLDETTVNALMPYSAKKDKELITCDEHTKVIKIKGFITNNIKSDREFNEKRQLLESGYDIQKVAFTLNTVNIQCIDRRMKIYNVEVDYKDTDERFFALRNQRFTRISEGKLKAILRIIKFQGNRLQEVIYKAKNEPRAVIPIPTECTIEDIKKLQGGNLTNVSTDTIKQTINKYVNPLNIAKGVATATMGTMIANSAKDLVMANGLSQGGVKAINLIQKMANESGELSAKFEKLAAERESHKLLDVARVMAIGHYYGEKVAHVINDKNNAYPSLKDVTRDICLARPVLEKMAYDLTALKVNQGLNKVASVEYNDINRAICNMDYLYKIACGVDRSIDINKLHFLDMEEM